MRHVYFPDIHAHREPLGLPCPRVLRSPSPYSTLAKFNSPFSLMRQVRTAKLGDKPDAFGLRNLIRTLDML